MKAGASYKIFDMEKEEYVEQTVFYPKKETISVFKTNEEGYLVTPEELKCSTYRIEEVKAPEGFVRQGYEMSLYEGETVISPLEVTGKGTCKENSKKNCDHRFLGYCSSNRSGYRSSHRGSRAAK